MKNPGTYQEMKQALLAVLLHNGGEIEVDLTDIGEAILAHGTDIAVERTAKGAVVKIVKSELAKYLEGSQS